MTGARTLARLGNGPNRWDRTTQGKTRHPEVDCTKKARRKAFQRAVALVSASCKAAYLVRYSPRQALPQHDAEAVGQGHQLARVLQSPYNR